MLLKFVDVTTMESKRLVVAWINPDNVSSVELVAYNTGNEVAHDFFIKTIAGDTFVVKVGSNKESIDKLIGKGK